MVSLQSFYIFQLFKRAKMSTKTLLDVALRDTRVELDEYHRREIAIGFSGTVLVD